MQSAEHEASHAFTRTAAFVARTKIDLRFLAVLRRPSSLDQHRQRPAARLSPDRHQTLALLGQGRRSLPLSGFLKKKTIAWLRHQYFHR